MNIKDVIERKNKLEAERAQVFANIQQLQANLNAYDGAIQDCEYWINAIESKKEAE